MNMKKKSLVAGLLAVSLAAQPVAATIAPKAVHAEGTEVKTLLENFQERVEKIVSLYINSIKPEDFWNLNNTKEVKDLSELYDKFNDIQKTIVKREVNTKNKGYFEIYEAIVKDYKDSNLVSDEEAKRLEELALKVIDITGLKVEDSKEDKSTALAKGKFEKLNLELAKKVYAEIRGEADLDSVLTYVGRDKDGRPSFNKEENTNNIKKLLGEDPIVVIQDGIKKESTSLEVTGTLEESIKFFEDYMNDVEKLDKFGKHVYTEELAKSINESGAKTRANQILALTGPALDKKLDTVNGKFEIKDEEINIKNNDLLLSDLEEVLDEFNKLPKLVQDTILKEVQLKGYKNAKKDTKPVDAAKLTFSLGKVENTEIDIKEKVEQVQKGIKALNNKKADFEKEVADLAAQENPSKAKAIALLNKYNSEEFKAIKDSISKETVKTLEEIIAGKPVAPVKETYYSLGVNVRDLEGNKVTRLDRGVEIPNAVRVGDVIKFNLNDKEVTAHINFVSKEKPLDAFYSKGGNVRETPDTKGLKLGYLPVNQIVLGEVTEDGVWVEIEFNGRKAFIANNRLSKEAVEVRYTSVGANVRNAAGEKVGYYKAGEVFKGVKEGNRIKVDYKGAVGYVHVAFVK